MSLAALILPPAFRFHLLGAFLVLRLQLGEPAPRLGVNGARLALAGPIERLASLRRLHRRRHRLDLRLLRHGPLDQRERAFRQDGDDLAVVLALRHRREPLPHGDLGILAHVREQVVAQGDIRDFLVVERLAGAAQDLYGRFGERHVTLRGSAVGTRWRLPFRRSEKVQLAY